MSALAFQEVFDDFLEIVLGFDESCRDNALEKTKEALGAVLKNVNNAAGGKQDSCLFSSAAILTV